MWLDSENKDNCLLSQTGNANQILVYFSMPSSYNVNDIRAKSVVIKTSGYENIHLTVMLVVLAVGSKLPLHVILNCKTMPKEKLPRGVNVRCQPKCWMTNEFMKDWLLVVWNRRPGALPSKQGMLVLDAFKGHLTPGKKATITGRSMNTDPLVIHLFVWTVF